MMILDHLRPSKTIKVHSLIPPSKGEKDRQMKLNKNEQTERQNEDIQLDSKTSRRSDKETEEKKKDSKN